MRLYFKKQLSVHYYWNRDVTAQLHTQLSVDGKMIIIIIILGVLPP